MAARVGRFATRSGALRFAPHAPSYTTNWDVTTVSTTLRLLSYGPCNG